MSEAAKKGKRDADRDKAELDKAPQPEIVDSDDEDSEEPPRTPRAMRQMMAAFMGFSRSSGGPVYHPIFDKFNDGHVIVVRSTASSMPSWWWRFSSFWSSSCCRKTGAFSLKF